MKHQRIIETIADAPRLKILMSKFLALSTIAIIICSNAISAKSNDNADLSFETNVFEVSVDRELADLVQSLSPDVLDQCVQKTEVLRFRQAQNKIPFFIAKTKKVLDQKVLDHHQSKIDLSDDGYVEDLFCAKGNPGVLFVTAETINLCVGSEAYWRDLISKNRFCPKLVHELVHVVQTELSGAGSIPPNQSLVDRLGPTWLLEGIAEYYAKAVVDEGQLLDRFEFHVRNNIPTGSKPIEQLEDYENRREYGNLHYLKGFIAARFLHRRNGDEAFFAFYSCLGKGAKWNSCFERSFGMSTEKFYEIKSLR